MRLHQGLHRQRPHVAAVHVVVEREREAARRQLGRGEVADVALLAWVRGLEEHEVTAAVGLGRAGAAGGGGLAALPVVLARLAPAAVAGVEGAVACADIAATGKIQAWAQATSI